jgi:hypothetical protein
MGFLDCKMTRNYIKSFPLIGSFNNTDESFNESFTSYPDESSFFKVSHASSMLYIKTPLCMFQAQHKFISKGGKNIATKKKKDFHLK